MRGEAWNQKGNCKRFRMSGAWGTQGISGAGDGGARDDAECEVGVTICSVVITGLSRQREIQS